MLCLQKDSGPVILSVWQQAPLFRHLNWTCNFFKVLDPIDYNGNFLSRKGKSYFINFFMPIHVKLDKINPLYCVYTDNINKASIVS